MKETSDDQKKPGIISVAAITIYNIKSWVGERKFVNLKIFKRQKFEFLHLINGCD